MKIVEEQIDTAKVKLWRQGGTSVEGELSLDKFGPLSTSSTILRDGVYYSYWFVAFDPFVIHFTETQVPITVDF